MSLGWESALWGRSLIIVGSGLNINTSCNRCPDSVKITIKLILVVWVVGNKWLQVFLQAAATLTLILWWVLFIIRRTIAGTAPIEMHWRKSQRIVLVVSHKFRWDNCQGLMKHMNYGRRMQSNTCVPSVEYLKWASRLDFSANLADDKIEITLKPSILN
jgi:hypothetical protein